MTPMPQEKLQQILKAIDLEVDKYDGDAPPVAAFDADGTLWTCDMGELFLLYQIKHKLLKRAPEDPWKEYFRIHDEISHKQAYLWLAQINAEEKIETVRGWADDFMRSLDPVPTFDEQKVIIDHLHSKGVKVYVVTASIKWSVEPGAKLYGIPQENVIGIQTKVKDGIVTTEQEGAITWREGKVEGLLLNTNNQRPIFASGNSDGDLALLESSTGLRLVMASAKPDEANYSTEKKMQDLAKERGWFYHSYVL